jgi:hypothetical protein
MSLPQGFILNSDMDACGKKFGRKPLTPYTVTLLKPRTCQGVRFKKGSTELNVTLMPIDANRANYYLNWGNCCLKSDAKEGVDFKF